MAYVGRSSNSTFLRRSDYGKRSWIRSLSRPRSHDARNAPNATKTALSAAAKSHPDSIRDAVTAEYNASHAQQQKHSFDVKKEERHFERTAEPQTLQRNYPKNNKSGGACCSACNALQTFVYCEPPDTNACRHWHSGQPGVELCGSSGGGGCNVVGTGGGGQWRDYDIESVDSNFVITRSLTARYSVLGDTFLYRVHVRGTLLVNDTTITLSLPQKVVSHCAAGGGADDQFGIAFVSSESDNMQMFAPIQIQSGANSFIVNQQALRAGVIYDIFTQGFIEIK